MLLQEFGLQRAAEFVFTEWHLVLDNVNVEREIQKRDEFWSDRWKILCPSPALVVLLSRVFKDKLVSLYLGIKVIFF